MSKHEKEKYSSVFMDAVIGQNLRLASAMCSAAVMGKDPEKRKNSHQFGIIEHAPAIFYAIINRDQDMTELLLDQCCLLCNLKDIEYNLFVYPAETSAVQFALCVGGHIYFKWLMNELQYANLDSTNVYGWSLLHYAVLFDNTCSKLVYEDDAIVERQILFTTDYDRNPLMLAAYFGRADFVNTVFGRFNVGSFEMKRSIAVAAIQKDVDGKSIKELVRQELQTDGEYVRFKCDHGEKTQLQKIVDLLFDECMTFVKKHRDDELIEWQYQRSTAPIPTRQQHELLGDGEARGPRYAGENTRRPKTTVV